MDVLFSLTCCIIFENYISKNVYFIYSNCEIFDDDYLIEQQHEIINEKIQNWIKFVENLSNNPLKYEHFAYFKQ